MFLTQAVAAAVVVMTHHLLAARPKINILLSPQWQRGAVYLLLSITIILIPNNIVPSVRILQTLRRPLQASNHPNSIQTLAGKLPPSSHRYRPISLQHAAGFTNRKKCRDYFRHPQVLEHLENISLSLNKLMWQVFLRKALSPTRQRMLQLHLSALCRTLNLFPLHHLLRKVTVIPIMYLLANPFLRLICLNLHQYLFEIMPDHFRMTNHYHLSIHSLMHGYEFS